MDVTDVKQYWADFQERMPEYQSLEMPPAYYFCDQEKDANECADLVRRGIKQATTHSLSWFQVHQEELPKVGDLAIVTDWHGRPMAIIRTSQVEIVAYKDISGEYAFIEGEGDKSLGYWKNVHWAYYSREMSAHNLKPSLDMKLVCEYFETIWPKS